MSKAEQFETFWRTYPRRVAKGAARKAFDKAIKKTSIDDMLKAIAAYIQHKPEKIDFKHPATWLNSECWDDEWQVASKPVFKSVADHFPTQEAYLAYCHRKNSEQLQ